ncbi:MAG: primosomal protein N' [Defluviitaleaceae bacterium]|nr:primosomal protein N' [Defluviitaleaceae bacterium]
MFAQIIVERSHKAIDRVFDYRVPEGMSLRPGMRVSVPFGAGNKPIPGYVAGLAGQTSYDAEKLKSVISVLGEKPVVTEDLLALAGWMREKYYCTLADCIGCVLPPGLELKSPKLRPGADALTGAVSERTLAPGFTADQKYVLRFFEDKTDNKPVLIHGVTGSGKTEIYMELTRRTMEAGKDVIMLVPEIALTPQTVAVFLGRFGDRVAVTHSRLSATERYEQWRKARDGRISVMIGPRSAIFAPFTNLGLIIIDEEHENTYKSETTPKYSAKEVAIERGKTNGALVVLGSATPSIETYHEAETGLIDLAVMPNRVNEQMPHVEIVDMRAELANGNMSIFSRPLAGALTETLEQGNQAILFLNRRGYSTFVSCRRCGAAMKCKNCNVNYTYHIRTGALLCHYCGDNIENPKNCPVCGSKYIKYFGTGTQRVEDEVLALLPQARVLRMDFDTTSKKFSHDKILEQFREGKADVLTGTQMIAKGLDFPKVTLVGVIAADLSLNNGDYRAAEITYQLLTQVSGRAGRAESAGKVFIQTYNPEHYAVTCASLNDYAGFFRHEISLRRQMDYPPFTKIFAVVMTGESEKDVISNMQRLRDLMIRFNRKGLFEIIGPAPAVISKIRKRYRWRMVVKSADEQNMRLFVFYCLDKLKQSSDLSGINISVTLDPAVLD